MKDWILVHNPAARRGRRILRYMADLLAGYPAIRQVRIDDLEELDARPSRVLAIGGDGTVRSVAQWLLREDLDAELAIVPAGTGNNLARCLDLPFDPRLALRLALRSHTSLALDVLSVVGSGADEPIVMVQSAALGFPATIAGRYDRLREHRVFRFLVAPTGPYVYRWLALAALGEQRRLERAGKNLLRLGWRLPGASGEETVLAVFVGNDGSLGGNFHPCPRARPDDGQLDMCLVRAGTGTSYLGLFRRFVKGTHLALVHAVEYRQSPGPLDLDFSRPVPLLVDGDVCLESDTYRFEVSPARLRIVISERGGADRDRGS